MSGSFLVLAAFLLLSVSGCDDSDSSRNPVDSSSRDAADMQGDVLDDAEDPADLPEEDLHRDPPENLEQFEAGVIFDLANTCVRMGVTGDDGSTRWLQASESGEGYAFGGGEGSKFFMKASDLGTFLFYDEGRGYLVGSEGALLRKTKLDSGIYLLDDSFVSDAEWKVEASAWVSNRFQLRSRRSERLMGPQGFPSYDYNAAHVVLEAVEGCEIHPEMTLDASGEVARTKYDDGDLFGFVDTHSHIAANFGFGGGGVFHGAPFHRLGVEHAMGSCELFHGEEGRADLLGFGSVGAGEGLDTESLIGLLGTGLLPEPNHATDGWPTFSAWPSYRSSTHQTQYYKWLERAWLSGLRLVIQHAVSNEAICQLMGNTGFQPIRYGCEDMLNVDRQIAEVRRMERYIDAQSGGPGEGWFRVVESPSEAREVIEAGKMAVVLGIEVPNLFSCYLTQRENGPECNDAYIQEQLDHYHDMGVRVLFPVHKYDNAFTPGDGDKGIFELGSFLQSGHWSNYVEDCPDIDTSFDKGAVQFGGLNQPRDAYLSPPPNELIELSMNPLLDFLPYTELFLQPGLEGDWCQKGTLTPAGETLIEGIMARGMILELDHLPRRSYMRVFEMIEEADYPAAGTHGNTNSGRLYDLGGISKSNFQRCADPEVPGTMASNFRERRNRIVEAGGYPAEGFGFDLNGFAGVPRARFGDDANCASPQENPVAYPFTSLDGGVTFTEPVMGQRAVDFNTEGAIHIGLVAELIEDARRTGVSDEDLEILFRSAEGYLRMWEKAEARGVVLRGE